MIYQVKGISGYVWDMHGCVLVCVGVCGCARVCSGVLRCAWVCEGVHGRAQVHAKVHTCMWVWLGGWVWYARVCMGVCGSVQKCEGVCKCVCWMNFQNIFWRLDSIHQRTLIRILYEFFSQIWQYLLLGNVLKFLSVFQPVWTLDLPKYFCWYNTNSYFYCLFFRLKWNSKLITQFLSWS